MISNAYLYAQQGIERAFADAARASKALVSSFTPSDDEASEPDLRDDQVVHAVVDLNRAKTALKANVTVMKVQNQMTGALLDILA